MRYIIFIIALFILSGCASVGKPIQQSSVNEIKKGITTKQEILDHFGQPDAISFDMNNRLTFSYYAAKTSSTVWNFIPVVNLVHGKMKQKAQWLVIVFNKDVVEEYSFINSEKPITYGIIP